MSPAAFVKVVVQCHDASVAAQLTTDLASLKKALRAEEVEIVTDDADRAMPGTLTKLGTIYLSLEGLVDKAAEAKRVNENFVAHAPAAIVEGQKTKRAELVANVARLEKLAKLFA